MIESGTDWMLVNGDCVEELSKLDADSVDLSIFSPPFQSLFVYTATERDIGNCATHEEFIEHLGYFIDGLLRVMKPGRLACCHIAQVTSTKATHGVIGLIDLRGAVTAAFVKAGFIYHGDVCIDKDPQAQAIRTHSKALLFVQLRKDSSWLRPALADYILVFRKPGDNAVPIHPDLTNNEWIEWARPIWYGIKETDTLNTAVAKENDDERHICPLQLGTIERCVRLWSNPGELVLSPFAGIGSEGYEAVRLGRRFVGVELKPSYAATAARNLRVAESLKQQGALSFSEVEV
jgi:DNA modification methylase